MIKTFRHDDLQAFFETGSTSGILPNHASKLGRQLARLDLARSAENMSVPGWRLHLLVGDLADHYLLWVNGNWRLTLTFEAGDAMLVDYRDYHREMHK